jgi:hypothetical protein
VRSACRIGDNPRVAWVLAIPAGALLAYLGVVLALLAMGRRTDARALAGFVPDCVVLWRRLRADRRVRRRHRALLAGLLGLVASPADLIQPRRGVRRSIVRRHWPGPPQSLRVVERIASRRS